MSTDAEESAFTATIKSALEESTQGLDSEVERRLHQARYRALEVRPRPLRWLVPASGFAAVSVALLAVTLWWMQPSWHAPVQGVEDFEILASGENLELFDDLDFYHWLAEQHPGG